MVFLGLEQPVAYGRELVFDPTTALMVLNANRDYINAVYNDYQQARQDMKDFAKEYGDFLSPIAKDMEWYEKNVTGDVRNFINNLYAQGIDPLRSQEGRSLVARKLASMPTGLIAQLRLSAEAAKEYIKNRGVLQAAGKWDPNFERFANQGNVLEEWDTINGGKGVWNRTSPAEMKTLKEATEDWFNNRTAHMLDKAGVESFGMQYDPNYDYTGFTHQDLLDIAASLTPGWNGSIYADYYRDVARQMVAANKALNGDMSPVTTAEIEKQLQQNIAIANKEYQIKPIKEANQFRLDDHRTANDIYAHRKKKAIDHEYWIKEQGGDGDKTKQEGYSLAKDVYGTSLAKAVGIEYLPQEGLTPYDLRQMLASGVEKQRANIINKGNVLDATGIFIAPEKLGGLIPANSEKDGVYILNSNFINQLYDLSDVKSSYKGWARKGDKTGKATINGRNNDIKKTGKYRESLSDHVKKRGHKIEIEVIPDKNGNNTYPIFGNDDRFRTYARVRVSVVDKNGKKHEGGGIPSSGVEMALKVGLESNIGDATPDLSVSARERIGRYPFDDTKKEIGLTGNADWPFGTNKLKEN